MTREPETLFRLLKSSIDRVMHDNPEMIPEVEEMTRTALFDPMFRQHVDDMLRSGDRAVKGFSTCDKTQVGIALTDLSTSTAFETRALIEYNDRISPVAGQVHFGHGSFGRAIPHVLGDKQFELRRKMVRALEECGCF